MSTSDAILLFSAISSLVAGIAVVVATFRGPVKAAQDSDTRRAAAERRADKMRVFRDLMGHRYDVMHSNYVAALNLVQIEFYEVSNVMNAYANYLSAFDPKLSDHGDVAEVRKKAIIRLLCAVGKHLGYELEQLDLMEQVYSPQGWATVADQQREIRELFTGIATGKRALPVLAVVPEVFVQDLGEGQAAIRVASNGAGSKPKRAGPSRDPPLSIQP